MSDAPVPSTDVFAQCPSGCVCGVRELVAREYQQGSRDGDEVDAAEMRSMLVAVRSGFETIRADTRLAARRHAANSAYYKATGRLNRLRMVVAERRAGAAARELAQVEAAATSHRRPYWLRRIKWPVIVGVGLFDVWYFSQVFRFLTSRTGDATDGGPGALVTFMEAVVAIVPGLVLAAIIATSGELLMRPVRAIQAASVVEVPTGKGNSGRVVRVLRLIWRALMRFLWWLLPVAFVGCLLFTIAIWAGLRARYPTPPAVGYPLASVMLLIVLLSAGAMVVKIAADDKDADRIAMARRRLWRHRTAYLLRAYLTDRSIGRYDSAWSDLRTLRDDLNGLLRVKMLSAWEGFILRIRSLHRMAGNVKATGVHDDRSPSHQEFVGIPQPALELGPLMEICRLIDERDPAELRRQKRDLDERFAALIAHPDT